MTPTWFAYRIQAVVDGVPTIVLVILIPGQRLP